MENRNDLCFIPEKLEIENSGYRTPKVNEAVAFICMLNAVLAENKIGTDRNVNSLSHKVIPMVPMSNTFIGDCIKLVRLFRDGF